MRILLACVLALLCGAAQSASQDDDFLLARDAFRVGDARRLDAAAARLKGHVLEPYVAYWQLRLRLEESSAGEIRHMLARLADGPLAERLRSDWLRFLARRQQWELFVAEYPQLVNPDTELTCYALQQRAARADADALREARALWFNGRDLPEACTPLFDALVRSGQITVADVWARIRFAFELGNVGVATRVAAYLPATQALDVRSLEAIAANPQAWVERKGTHPATRPERETVMFAVHRLARSAPQQAAYIWNRMADRFAAPERAYVWGWIAYYGAMRHDPAALEWYGRAGELTELQLAWRVRAALRARNWAEVLAATDAMWENQAREPAWRYWRARALKASGRSGEANALLAPLATEHHFYGLLASEELGAGNTVPGQVYKPSADEVKAIGALGSIRRALAFYRLDLRVEGNREWLWTIKGFDDKQLLAAAELARRNELWDRAINTAEQTVQLHDFSVRYLAPYRDILSSYAREQGLDEAWVYGLIRQESRFISGAKSGVGASGLMQLMPATARWVAGKLGLKDYRQSLVNQVDLNVSLGTYYLKHVLDLLDNQPVLASAAYNAGPGRAKAWRPVDAAMEGAVYSETIPFNETRDYVKKVMANAVYYAQGFGAQLKSLKQRLGVIAPKSRANDRPLDDTP